VRKVEAHLDEAKAFLEDRFGDRASDVAPLGSGFWSRAYAFRLDGEDMVVRFAIGRAGYDNDRFATSLAGPDLPVPEVVEIGDLDGGGSYSISVRYHGRFLEDLPAACGPWLEPALWRMLDALRVAPATCPANAGWRRPGEVGGRTWREALTLPYSPFAPDVTDLEKRLAAWPDVDDVVARARSTIASFVDAGYCPEIRHVLHADLLHQNVLVDEGTRSIAAVLDWGQMAYGDFVFDVGALAFHAPWFPAIAAVDLPRSAPRHFERIGLEVPDFDVRLHCYAIRVGLDRILSAAASRWWDLLRPPDCAGHGSDSIEEVARRTAALVEAGPSC
jgi:hygromycin-B 4-O-kinase